MKNLSLYTRIHYLKCKSFGLGFLYSITKNRLFFDKKIRTGILIISLINLLIACQNTKNEQSANSQPKQTMDSVSCYDATYPPGSEPPPPPPPPPPIEKETTTHNKTNHKSQQHQIKTTKQEQELTHVTAVCYMVIDTNYTSKNNSDSFLFDSKDSVDVNKTYLIVDEIPTLPDVDLAKYIRNKIIYPQNAIKKRIEGRVILQFVVNIDGSISDIEVVRRVSPELDKEAIRIIKSMPKWIPAREHNIPVRVKYTLPVNFKLPNANP